MKEKDWCDTCKEPWASERCNTCKYGYGKENNYKPMSTPSRICSVCRKLEFPNAIMCTETGWICPECAKRIKRMIYKGDDDG